MKSIKNKIIISLSAMILFAGGLVSFANKPALEATAPAAQKNVQGVELNIAAANEAAKKAPVSENITDLQDPYPLLPENSARLLNILPD